MSAPQRIVILGASGSGKSTLARAIGAKLGLPVVHLDSLFWLPGWVQCPTPEFRARIVATHAGERWISEGNYSTRSWDLRMPRADMIIRLRQSRWTCLRRMVMRTIGNYGRTRDDLGPECPEKFDAGSWELVQFIWKFEASVPLADKALAAMGCSDKVIDLHGDAAVRDFLRGFESVGEVQALDMMAAVDRPPPPAPTPQGGGG